MERKDPAASGNTSANWAQNSGITRNGLDANSAALNGTARVQNSVFNGPTPTPTATPSPTGTPARTATPMITPTPTITPTGQMSPTSTPSAPTPVDARISFQPQAAALPPDTWMTDWGTANDGAPDFSFGWQP